MTPALMLIPLETGQGYRAETTPPTTSNDLTTPASPCPEETDAAGGIRPPKIPPIPAGSGGVDDFEAATDSDPTGDAGKRLEVGTPDSETAGQDLYFLEPASSANAPECRPADSNEFCRRGHTQ